MKDFVLRINFVYDESENLVAVSRRLRDDVKPPALPGVTVYETVVSPECTLSNLLHLLDNAPEPRACLCINREWFDIQRYLGLDFAMNRFVSVTFICTGFANI